ncbi:MAG: adenosylcobinamide-GDP ribazoletransferase [Kiritimatiellia bacterium]
MNPSLLNGTNRLPAAGAEGWRRCRQAMCLLTRLPVPVAWEPDLKWGQLAGWYPAVGGLIGIALVLLAWLWGQASDFTMMGGVLVLAAWVALTGALHLDGWGDCMDAFFTPVSRGRRLEIMADPRMGSFGTIGLILLLMAKGAGLVYVLSSAMGRLQFRGQMEELWPLVVACVSARAVLALVLADPNLPLAKAGGMGAKARDGLAGKGVIQAAATALVVSVLGGWRGMEMAGVALFAGFGFAYLARQRIGGLTGDVLGGVVESAETAALIAVTFNG